MSSRGVLCTLPRLPYGIFETGRPWLCSIEFWRTKTYGMDHVVGVDQLFIKRSHDSSISLIVAEVIDDF